MIFNTKFNNYSLNFIKVLLIAKIEIKERNTSLNLVLFSGMISNLKVIHSFMDVLD